MSSDYRHWCYEKISAGVRKQDPKYDDFAYEMVKAGIDLGDLRTFKQNQYHLRGEKSHLNTVVRTAAVSRACQRIQSEADENLRRTVDSDAVNRDTASFVDEGKAGGLTAATASAGEHGQKSRGLRAKRLLSPRSSQRRPIIRLKVASDLGPQNATQSAQAIVTTEIPPATSQVQIRKDDAHSTSLLNKTVPQPRDDTFRKRIEQGITQAVDITTAEPGGHDGDADSVGTTAAGLSAEVANHSDDDEEELELRLKEVLYELKLKKLRRKKKGRPATGKT